MSSNQQQPLRLMLVDQSIETAEAIVSNLRNEGIAVRPMRPNSSDEIQQMIGSQPVDLVLASYPGSNISAAGIIPIIHNSGKDIPVLALVETIDTATLEQIHTHGLRGCALQHSPKQLLVRIHSEWEDLQARRSRRKLEAQIRETERRCDALIESSRDPIAYVHQGMHIRANSAYLEMFGFQSEDDIEGVSLLDLISGEHVDTFKELLKSLSKGEQLSTLQYKTQARTLDGESFAATMEFTPAMYEGEACQQVIFRRQQMDESLVRELEELRQRDPITGLYNRTAFLHLLEDSVAGVVNGDQQHGLLLIEPDQYQRLLQSVGLESADLVIKALAQRLQTLLGDEKNIALARFGEHSLAVLLKHADHLRTNTTAERIRDAFASHVFEIGTQSPSITVSIGGVQIGERIASVNTILGRAANNVQSAVGVGGNRVELYDPGAADRAEAERFEAWGNRLRQALRDDSFTLNYQPIISLQGDGQARYECLVRLKTEGGELMPPSLFFEIAEQHGLLADIDHWVIRHAIASAAAKQQQGKPVSLLIKISQEGLAQADALVVTLRDALAQHHLPAHRVILEVTESKVFSNIKATQGLFTQLRAIGVLICLGKFGAGVDSFQLMSHLQQSLPTFVKIDGGFIEDLSSSTQSQEKVQEIAARCAEMGIRCIAEKVSDASSMAVLFSSGVELVLGEFLSGASESMQYDFG